MSSCAWVKHPEEQTYHDNEWGVTSTDERYLFEMLVLEGMQAGLSWITILRKRGNYKTHFQQFSTQKILAMQDEDLEALLLNEDAGIIRNRNKVFAIRNNAQRFEEVQEEFGSFHAYVWSFVPEQKKIINDIHTSADVLAQSDLSVTLSKDLKKRGFKFVGPVIIYSYLQAIGVIDDHENSCDCKSKK